MNYFPLPTEPILPSLIDYRLKTQPESTFALFSSSDDELNRITFLEFGRACQRLARIVAPAAPLKSGYPVAIVANCDTLQYITAVGGLAYAGLAAFPISSRLPAAAVLHLLKNVSAHRLLTTSASLGSFITELRQIAAKSDYAIDIEEIPSLTESYPRLAKEVASDPFEPVEMPAGTAFPDAVEIYLHSSGSTGAPKSIPYTHEYLNKLQYSAPFADLTNLPENFVLFSGMMPCFHTLGLHTQLFHPLFTGRPAAIFPPQYPEPPIVPSPVSVLDGLKRTKSHAVWVVPSLLESWSFDPEAVQQLKTLNMIFYGGGPLAQDVGNKLVDAGCRILSGYGTTELGCVTHLYDNVRPREDWEWMKLYDNVTPRWDDHGEGLYELQLLTTEKFQPARENLSDVAGYATSDLWVQHPTRADLWKPVARVDDLIIMANGEKAIPTPLESALLSHPSVHGAIAFGRSRDQIGILVEPVQSALADVNHETLSAFRDLIWPAVEAGNREVPAYAQVYKEMLLIVTPEKPLPRTAKGTVSRAAALLAYEAEIASLYDMVESETQKVQTEHPPHSWHDHAAVQSWLTSLIVSISGHDIESTVDLFAQGVDSLAATLFRRRIVMALRGHEAVDVQAVSRKITQDFVYVHPTIVRLAQAIGDLLKAPTSQSPSPLETVLDLVRKHTEDMHSSRSVIDQPFPASPTVLLTGSTGFLGGQILTQLLDHPNVAQVYVYNRPSMTGTSSKDRHIQAFCDRGLDVTLLDSPKLEFLEGHANQKHLGLTEEQYEKLVDSVDTIIHNAWSLNFNLGVQAFDNHIAGTRALADLALASPKASPVRMILASSIAVAQNWGSKDAFPEEYHNDARHCLGGGYGESKFVAEQILKQAGERGVQTSSIRIGQITGNGTFGAWATSDWVPILTKSAVALGHIPEAFGHVSWIAPETVARAFIEVATTQQVPLDVLHATHDHPILWRTVAQYISQALKAHGITSEKLSVTPMDQWFALLASKQENATAQDLQAMPALKLYSFFEHAVKKDAETRAFGNSDAEAIGLAHLDMSKSTIAAPALLDQAPVTYEDVHRWIGYWKANGLFSA